MPEGHVFVANLAMCFYLIYWCCKFLAMTVTAPPAAVTQDRHKYQQCDLAIKALSLSFLGLPVGTLDKKAATSCCRSWLCAV